MEKPKKHFIGIGLFLILLMFFYTYSLIVFSIYNESSILIECIFLSIYLCLLIALTMLYVKNNLILEYVLLLLFSLVFANPFTLGLIYYPIFVAFEGTSTLEVIDKYFHVLTYPFDLFYDYGSFFMMFFSVIPLTSLVSMLKKKFICGSN